MKFIVFFSLFSLLFSCAPEKTMNRKIDGTWNLVNINGSALPSNFSEKVTFKPEGRNGTITFQISENGKSIDSIGTYTIMKYEYITTSFMDNSKLGYKETIFTFTKCTSSELILTQQNGSSNVYYFQKEN
jgi:hypothetical protein